MVTVPLDSKILEHSRKSGLDFFVLWFYMDRTIQGANVDWRDHFRVDFCNEFLCQHCCMQRNHNNNEKAYRDRVDFRINFNDRWGNFGLGSLLARQHSEIIYGRSCSESLTDFYLCKHLGFAFLALGILDFVVRKRRSNQGLIDEREKRLWWVWKGRTLQHERIWRPSWLWDDQTLIQKNKILKNFLWFYINIRIFCYFVWIKCKAYV